ncbi:MAG: branched-chain amino acid ABC transporter permease [Proteobacteria bacterium]|nr:branched-chain amino acid ABC transporter permease [Pseudomonadota bacterium]
MQRGERISQILVALATIALVALPVVAATFGSTYAVTLATRLLIYGMVAVSLDLIIGYGGLISFGHAAYFGLGGYTVAILAFQLAEGVPIFGYDGTNEALVAWPLAMLVSGLAALVFGALSLRTSGAYFIMITLAFAQMVYYVFVALKYYGGDDGLAMARRNTLGGARIVDPQIFYYICLGLLAAVIFLVGRFTRSRFGMVLTGARMNERRMAALGFSVMRYRLVAFVIAGMIAGLGGALWANLARFVSPDMMAWTKSGEFMVMVILGGLGSLFGPVLGAAAFILVESTLSELTEYWQVLFGPVVVLIALFAPRGLWGWLTVRRRGA